MSKLLKVEVLFDEPTTEQKVTDFRDKLYRFLMSARREFGIGFSMVEE